MRQFLIDQLKYNDNTVNPVRVYSIISLDIPDVNISTLMDFIYVPSYLQQPVLRYQWQLLNVASFYRRKSDRNIMQKISSFSRELLLKLIGIVVWTG